MSTFNFKKEVSVYVVFNDEKYNITVNSIDFTQALSGEEVKTRTLQEPNNLFSKMIIDKAVPATFDLVVYAIREDDFKVLFNRALDCLSFDLYILTQQSAFKIETCVITNTRFIVEKGKALTIGFSGQGSKISRVGSGSYTVPGTEITRASVETYNILRHVDITLGTNNFDKITEVSIELQNNIKWLDDDIVGVCGTTPELHYVSDYIIDKKILSGTFSTYDIYDRDWSTSEALQIVAGQKVNDTVYGFNLDIDSVAFTNRENIGSVFTQSYDWRMTQNPEFLQQVIDYVTYLPGTQGAILDYLGQPILDHLGEAILEST